MDNRLTKRDCLFTAAIAVLILALAASCSNLPQMPAKTDSPDDLKSFLAEWSVPEITLPNKSKPQPMQSYGWVLGRDTCEQFGLTYNKAGEATALLYARGFSYPGTWDGLIKHVETQLHALGFVDGPSYPPREKEQGVMTWVREVSGTKYYRREDPKTTVFISYRMVEYIEDEPTAPWNYPGGRSFKSYNKPFEGYSIFIERYEEGYSIFPEQ